MRQTYSVGITVAKAWRAKLIAKKIIEGDADNQYASIWRYAEELRRVNHGNTVKINVERPSPSIQPRFGSFYFCFDGLSPINGQDMWPEVEMEPPLPPAYKNGPGRPKKIRIRESGEDGARKRRSGVAYKCTKCDNFGHNAMTCKATTQDPNALKRKRKPKKGHVSTATDIPTANDMPTASDMPAPTATDMTVPTNVPVPTDPQPPTDMPVPTIMSQTGSSVAASITKQSRKRVEKKPIIKRRQSERIKLSWFKRPITGEGISSDKPITLPENEDIPTLK
ncbi:hypothetical protein KIW84_023207 [Lathyrus oleraceus]|uniref:Uncharacterized protein n=1 Tax=Pisum sativum TaxID=3888 RepID=A0A9D4YGV1_PEA|nr:hypothetical protein KIW84_023207 [Pisum sativum]